MEAIEVVQEIARGEEYITDRELAVVRLIATGKYSLEIADELGISPKTVEVHRHNALRRTKSRNMPMLVSRLFRDKLLKWDGDNLA